MATKNHCFLPSNDKQQYLNSCDSTQYTNLNLNKDHQSLDFTPAKNDSISDWENKNQGNIKNCSFLRKIYFIQLV